MTDYDDEYTPDPDPDDYRDDGPVQEEPNFEDELAEAEYHARAHNDHASEARRMMRVYDSLGPHAAAESEALDKAQIHATLAAASATMHAAALAAESATVPLSAAYSATQWTAWPSAWVLAEQDEEPLRGLYLTQAEAQGSAYRYWHYLNEQPDGSARVAFEWRSDPGTPQHTDLLADGRPTGIVVYERAFGSTWPDAPF